MISTLLSLVLAADQATLAMTSLECYPAKLCSGEREPNRAYLQSKLEQAVLGAANNRIKLITPEVVLRILKESGQTEQQARETCLNATCAADLGGALGADFIVQGRIMQPGTNDWELSLKLWSIAESNVLADESVNASRLLNLKSEMSILAKQTLTPVLKRNRRRKVESNQVMGFDDEESAPSIESGQITEAVGGLMIAGSPSFARVTAVGRDRKQLKLKVGDSIEGLKPGTYTWTAVANNYESTSGTVKVVPDGFATIPLKLRKLASLSVIGSPDRAKVEIIGPKGERKKPVGIGSKLQGLVPGTYKVRVSKGGFEPETKTVPLNPGAKATVSFKLLQLGGLEVSGKPLGAIVNVQSITPGFQNRGGLPWKATGLKSGFYKITTSRRGYHEDQRTVKVSPGAGTQQVVVKLKRKSRFKEKVTSESKKSRNQRARSDGEASKVRPQTRVQARSPLRDRVRLCSNAKACEAKCPDVQFEEMPRAEIRQRHCLLMCLRDRGILSSDARKITNGICSSNYKVGAKSSKLAPKKTQQAQREMGQPGHYRSSCGWIATAATLPGLLGGALVLGSLERSLTEEGRKARNNSLILAAVGFAGFELCRRTALDY